MTQEFYNLIEADYLTAFLRERIRIASEDRESNRFILNRWFPNESTATIDIEWDAGPTRTFETAIPFRTWTTRSDLGKRDGMVRKSGQIPPFSRMYAMTERDIIKLREAVAQGGQAGDFAGEVFLRDVDKLVRGMLARMEIAIADSLNLGNIAMAGENGVRLTVDWSRSASHTADASVSWATPATATPFDDEEGRLDILETDADLFAEDLVAVCNETTYRLWKNTTQVKESIRSVGTVNRISDNEVTEIRREHGLPDFLVYKAKARNVDGTVRSLIPDGRILYLPRSGPVGATKWASPAVANDPDIELDVNLDPGPVAYMTKSIEPYGTYVHGQGVAFPIFADTESTAVLDATP